MHLLLINLSLLLLSMLACSPAFQEQSSINLKGLKQTDLSRNQHEARFANEVSADGRRYLGDLFGGQMMSGMATKSLGLEQGNGVAFYRFTGIPDVKVSGRHTLSWSR